MCAYGVFEFRIEQRSKYKEKTKCYASILIKLSIKIPLNYSRGIKYYKNLI
jgi:hypothetical protein